MHLCLKEILTARSFVIIRGVTILQITVWFILPFCFIGAGFYLITDNTKHY